MRTRGSNSDEKQAERGHAAHDRSFQELVRFSFIRYREGYASRESRGV